MFFDANHELKKVADYKQLPDGTWTAEVRALKLHVSGPTPNDCWFRLFEEFDKRVAAWIVQMTKSGSQDKTPRSASDGALLRPAPRNGTS
jgi:hypothetical protein